MSTEQQKSIEQRNSLDTSGKDVINGTKSDLNTLEASTKVAAVQGEVFEVSKERISNLKNQFKQYKKSCEGKTLLVFNKKKGNTPEAKAALEIINDRLEGYIKKLEGMEKTFKDLNKSSNVDFKKYGETLNMYEELSEKMPGYIQDASLGKKVNPWNPIHSSKDAKDMLKTEADVAQENIDKAFLLASLIKTHLFNETQSALQDFINGTLSHENKVDFCMRNMHNFQQLKNEHALIYNQLVQATGLEAFLKQYCSATMANNYPNACNGMEGRQYNNLQDAVANRGIYGGIDYLTRNIQSQDPRSQDFYRTGGNLLLTAGGIFLGWKALSTIWNKCFGSEEKKKAANRGWVVGPAALLFATGGRPQEIFKGGEVTQRLMGLFGGNGGGNVPTAYPATYTPNSTININAPTSQETAQQKETREYNEKKKKEQAYAIPTSMAILNGLTYGQVNTLLEEENGTLKLKKDTLTTLETQYNDPSLSSEEKNLIKTKIDTLKNLKDDQFNLINDGLVAMGITKEKLTDKPDKQINDDFTKYIINQTKLASENFEKVSDDPEKRKKLDEYLKTGKPNVDELVKEGVLILKITDESHTAEQIKTLGLSHDDEYLVQRSCNEISEKMLDTSKDLGIQLKKEGENILFSSYEKEIKINLKNKQIDGLTKSGGFPMTFKSIDETLKAANLINAIKYDTRYSTVGENTKGEVTFPFHKNITGDIIFEGVGGNTKVLNATWLINNTLKEVSPILSEHKDDFIRYLNNQKFWLTAKDNTPPQDSKTTEEKAETKADETNQ